MRNTVAALIATMSIATFALPASAAPAKTPQTTCEQVMKGENAADVDCTATNSIGQQNDTQKGSKYPSAPSNIGSGVWF